MKINNAAYQEPRVLTFVLLGLLIAHIANSALLLISELAVYAPGYTRLAMMQFNLLLLTMVWAWPVLIVKSFWIYRISSNSHLLTQRPMQFSPAWAVGWSFIPLANLVQSYRVVSELYNVNRHPYDWDSSVSLLIVAWWGIALLGALNSIATVTILVKHIQGYGIAAQTSHAIVIVHLTLSAIIIARIARAQKRAHDRPGLEDVF
jgi:hypothetical protein